MRPEIFKYLLNTCLAICVLMLFANAADAQRTVVRGRVTDAYGNEPLPYVSVGFLSSNTGTNTDEKGYFVLSTDKPLTQLQFSYIGYHTVVKTVKTGVEQVINIRMQSQEQHLTEVVIRPRKVRYRNKDNPAVELIRKVIAHKSSNQTGYFDYAQYRQYEKLKFSLTNTAEKFRKNPLLKRYRFLTDNLDTVTLEGKALLNWYIQEVIADVYYRKSPEKKKTYVIADKRVNLGEFIDQKGMNDYLKHMYRDVDIYKDNINIVTNEFLSPIAELAPNFYRFYITDTVQQEGEQWVELSFFPRNKTDFLFQGKLYVPLDGRYAVSKVDMKVNRNINLNWVRDLRIIQDFEKGDSGRYFLSRNHMLTEFSLLKSGSGPGMFGDRVITFSDYRINIPGPDSVYQGPDMVAVKPDTSGTPVDSFWAENRPGALTQHEALTYVNIDSLQKLKSFRRTMDLLTLAVAGYKRASPYAEIGPVNTFYSFNPVEGFRLRAGGRTTPRLSKRIYGEGYAAYGFKDQRWKYYIGGIYSFTNRSIFEFPVRTLRANFQRDTKIPGQELQFVQEDNFLLSFKRGVNDKWLYNDIWNVEYLHEFQNHFSYKLGLKNWKQTPAGGLSYAKYESNVSVPVPDLTTSEVNLELRWAPNEEFYQGKLYRTPIRNRYPVFTLRSAVGVKGVLNSGYDYQNLVLNIYKHVYLSQLGYSDVVLEGGYYFGKVPYPLLNIHRANQTYSLQLMSYNLMNFQEFVSDHFASFTIDHCFNGFIFNKLPLIKKLRFREVVNLKVLYGGLRAENDPDVNPETFHFPVDANGVPSTFKLGNEPYVEGSVGISNILNFFRIDVVKRFTYLDHPNISEIGIRARFRFDF